MDHFKGTTSLYCLLGSPVQNSLSPVIQNAALSHFALDACYLAFDVPKDRLPSAVEGLGALGIKGCNVTMPLKEAIIPLLHTLSPGAEAMGAVNTVTVEIGEKPIFTGYNTDGQGLLRALRAEASFHPRGKKALCLGAGGSARAGLFALAQAGLAAITIYNRGVEKAKLVQEQLLKAYPHLQVETLCSEESSWEEGLMEELSNNPPHVLLNTTPRHQWPQDLPFSPQQVVCDLVYGEYPSKTPLLLQAEKAKAHIVTGLAVLVHQGALAFSLWTGETSSVPVMWKALKKGKGGYNNDTGI